MYVFLRNGKPVRFDESVGDMYMRHFRSGRFYEQDFLCYVESLKLKGTYLDIGGHVGNHTVFFGLFCESLAVITFEPIPRYLNTLNRNILLNGLQQKAIVISQGLSDCSGSREITFDNLKETIITTTLDQIMSLIPSPHNIVVMKIDVEGMESLVIGGARDTINLHKPIVYAEALGDDARKSLFSIMESLDYQWSGKVFNASPTYEFIHPKAHSHFRERLKRWYSI